MVVSFLFLRSAWSSWPIFPVQIRMRSASPTSVSGMTFRKFLWVKSAIGELASGWRSMLFGVKTTSGLRQWRRAWRRRRWKYCAALRRLRDLNIVLGGELDEALDSRAGMFRALAFVAVGQEHDDTGEQVPLGFSGADELVDDGLRDVDEVAELGFPEDERFGIVAAVAVFEAEDSGFGKRGVVDFAAGLTGRDVLQRHVFVFVLDVD